MTDNANKPSLQQSLRNLARGLCCGIVLCDDTGDVIENGRQCITTDMQLHKDLCIHRFKENDFLHVEFSDDVEKMFYVDAVDRDGTIWVIVFDWEMEEG